MLTAEATTDETAVSVTRIQRESRVTGSFMMIFCMRNLKARLILDVELVFV